METQPFHDLVDPADAHGNVAHNKLVRSAATTWLAQLVTLLHKNLKVLIHRRVSALLVLAMPSVFIIALAVLHSALPSSTTSDVVIGVRHCETFSVYGKVCEKLSSVPDNSVFQLPCPTQPGDATAACRGTRTHPSVPTIFALLYDILPGG